MASLVINSYENNEYKNDDFDQDLDLQSITKKKPQTNILIRIISSRQSFLKLLFTAIIVCLALWGLFDLISRLLIWTTATLSDSHSPCWCGSSDAEAVAMGCRWDHIAVDWLPDSCIDDDLIAEFDASGPELNGAWPYFTLDDSKVFHSINLTDIEQLAIDGKDYWTTREWHVAHCFFTWRKQFRVQLDNKDLEPWNDHEGHIKHCSEYILRALRSDHLRLDDIDTIILGKDRHPENESRR